MKAVLFPNILVCRVLFLAKRDMNTLKTKFTEMKIVTEFQSTDITVVKSTEYFV